MTRRKNYDSWYVEAEGEFTNQHIAHFYDSMVSCFEGMMCADGVRRNLWEVSKNFIDSLSRSKAQGTPFHFRVFGSSEGSAPKEVRKNSSCTSREAQKILKKIRASKRRV